MGLAGSGGQDHPDHPVFQIPRGGPGRSGAPVRLQRGPLPAQQRARQDGPLYLVDVLYNEFIRQHPETARANQERIAEALAEKHL